MPTLFDPSTRDAIHARVDGLDAEQAPHWGKMHTHQMVCHVSDQLRVALGDIESRPRPLLLRLGDMEVKTSPGLLRFRWYRQVMVHWAPWPKERIKAPPEMFSTTPANWRDDVAALHVLIDRVGDRDPAADWPCTPGSDLCRGGSGACWVGSIRITTCGNSVFRILLTRFTLACTSRRRARP